MSDEFEKLLREGLDQLTEGRISESRDAFLKVIRHSAEIGDRFRKAAQSPAENSEITATNSVTIL